MFSRCEMMTSNIIIKLDNIIVLSAWNRMRNRGKKQTETIEASETYRVRNIIRKNTPPDSNPV